MAPNGTEANNRFMSCVISGSTQGDGAGKAEKEFRANSAWQSSKAQDAFTTAVSSVSRWKVQFPCQS